MMALKFGFVGIANTILSYVLFVVLIKLSVYYLLASTVSFVIGTMFSYVLNSRYTFKNPISLWVYVRFFAVNLISLCVSLLMLFILKQLLGFNVYFAQIAVILVRFPIVYIVNREVVFGTADNSG